MKRKNKKYDLRLNYNHNDLKQKINMKTKLILLLFIPFIQSCLRTLPDEALTMARIPYTGKEIRLDGCYISDPFESNKNCEYDFFYSNGIFLGFSDVLNINNLTQVTGGIDIYRKNKDVWGVFQVENNIIKAQLWKSNVDAIQLIVQNRTYKIINDTTLSIDLLNDGDIRYYHFKNFIPKPDSTNTFIK